MIQIAKRVGRFAVLFAWLGWAGVGSAEVRLGGVFTDHMVLQREMATPVWGWADPGEKVTVEFAGQKVFATAGADGRWTAHLAPLTASSAGQTLRAIGSNSKHPAAAQDVLVGEVWLCSGQSNMAFRMSGILDAPKELAASDDPLIRFFTVAEHFDRKPATDVKGQWQVVTPKTAGSCSAVALCFAEELQPKLGVPVGLVVSSVGGTIIESWIARDVLTTDPAVKPSIERWDRISDAEFEQIGRTYREFQRQRDFVHPREVAEAKAAGKPVPPAPVQPKLRLHDCPCALYNGMIWPLAPLSFRGAVWYQGESNAGRAAEYRKLLPMMIADWRKTFGREFPVLVVQLPKYRGISPEFRDAQLQAARSTPRTDLVVTFDVGEASNIHPRNKRPVGRRLAQAARADVYGEPVEGSGPEFQALRIAGKRAVLTFTHAGGGLVAEGGAPLRGFTIAGPDGTFVPARAAIEGDTVVVTAPSVPSPTAVRYGWSNLPDGNLWNKAGLPASPFRTDEKQEK